MLIDAVDIKKSFGKLEVLKGVSLSVDYGEFVALLGPNGAGKTTLVEIIEGLQKPNSGTVKIAGLNWKDNAKEIHKKLGISLQENHFFERITVWETLRLFASLYNISSSEQKARAEEALELVSLQEKRDVWTVKLSGGQKQRLALAVSMINRPEILILDEPTTGLDPAARVDLWNLLKKMKSEYKMGLLLTTHYMEEAEVLCDRIILLDHGVKIKEGRLNELLVDSGVATLDDLFLKITGKRLSQEGRNDESTL